LQHRWQSYGVYKYHKLCPRHYARRIRWANIKRLYGLSKAQWYAILDQQNGCCDICKKKFDLKFTKEIHVDHGHNKNKAVRGLLCHNCNTSMGKLKDNRETLQNAIDYLDKWSGKNNWRHPTLNFGEDNGREETTPGRQEESQRDGTG